MENEKAKQRAKDVEQIVLGLQSGEVELQLEALDYAREHGSADILPSLVGLLCQRDTDQEVHHQLVDLLLNVRDSGLVDVILAALTAHEEEEIWTDLISICWMNSMDFSALIPFFVQALTSSSVQLVVESITALEMALDHAVPEQIQTVVERLKQMQREGINATNRPFVDEMISVAAQAYQMRINARRELEHQKAHPEA